MIDRPPDVMLTIPLPPSANRLQRHTARAGRAIRYSTREYRDWQSLAGAEASAQAGGQYIPWRYQIRITVPESRKDLGNYEKPISDLLQSVGLLGDDKFAQRIEMVVDPERKIPRALVEIWSLGPKPEKPKRARRSG